jgi:hypothetical protein
MRTWCRMCSREDPAKDCRTGSQEALPVFGIIQIFVSSDNQLNYMGLQDTTLTFKAVVLTADKFEDMEVFFPFFRLLEQGWLADIAAPDRKEITGEHGYILQPDKTIAEIDPGEYDLLLIPGGSPGGAPATVRKIQKAQEIARSFFKNGSRDLSRALDPCFRRRGEGQAPHVVLARWYARGYKKSRRHLGG